MAWWALAMVFGSLPGICLVGYTWANGYQDQKCSVKEYLNIWGGVRKAKKGAINDTGRLLGGNNGKLLALMIGFILLVIATDTVMLIAINLSSIPISLLAYRFGRNHRISGGIDIEKARRILATGKTHNEVGTWKYVTSLIVLWVAIVSAILGLLYYLGLWHPQ